MGHWYIPGISGAPLKFNLTEDTSDQVLLLRGNEEDVTSWQFGWVTESVFFPVATVPKLYACIMEGHPDGSMDMVEFAVAERGTSTSDFLIEASFSFGLQVRTFVYSIYESKVLFWEL